MLERSLQSDTKTKAAASKFVYLHINCDKDKEAWNAWNKKYKSPGNAIPVIWIVKPNGEQAHSQLGGKDFVQLLTKYGKELASAATLTPKQLGLIKAAAKEAEALLEEGRFVSAYERLAEYAEDINSENKALTKVKATVKKIEQAALEKIDSAKELLETAKSEPKKFDGAFQLTVIAASLQDLEAVHKKAESAISKLKEGKNADLFVQAKLLFDAREAAREEDTAKAKKLYEKLIADHKGSEAAKRAKTRLDELEGGS
jgi:hypothetical protein